MISEAVMPELNEMGIPPSSETGSEAQRVESSRFNQPEDEKEIDEQVDEVKEGGLQDVLTPEARQKLVEFYQKMDEASGYEAKKQAWTEFFVNNVVLAQLFRETKARQPQPESVGPDSASESTSDAREEAEGLVQKVETKIVDVLKAKIIELVSQTEVDKRENLVREYLQAQELAQSSVEAILKIVLSENFDEAQLEEAIKAGVEQNPTAIAEEIFDEQVKESLAEFNRLAKRMSEIGGDKKELQENYKLFQKAGAETEQVVDSVDVTGMIDLIFATGHGFGGYGGRIDRWKDSDVNKDQETKTLAVLKEVLIDSEAAAHFYAEATGVDREGIFSRSGLTGKLEEFFSPLENGDNEIKKEIKDKIAQAVDKGSEAAALMVELKADDVSLSGDVLKFIIHMAKEHVAKNS